MSVLSKILAGTVLGAGVIAGIEYFTRLRKAQVELEIIPRANIYALSWDGLTIKVDVQLKNPTKGSFSLKFPFVKIIYKGNTVGSSQVVDRDIKIPAYGEVMIEKIMVQIPVTSVFSVVFGLIKSLFNKEPVKISVKTMTTVDVGLAKIPYDNETELTIKK